MNIGENIRFIRELKGLSQQGLADELGISQKSLSRIEVGQVSPAFSLVQDICLYLKTDLIQLSRFNQKQLFDYFTGKELPKDLPVNFDEIRQLYQMILTEKERYIKSLEHQVESLTSQVNC